MFRKARSQFSVAKATLQSQMSVRLSVIKTPFNLNPSSFNILPSSFDLHPSSFNFHHSSFNLHPSFRDF